MRAAGETRQVHDDDAVMGITFSPRPHGHMRHASKLDSSGTPMGIQAGSAALNLQSLSYRSACIALNVPSARWPLSGRIGTPIYQVRVLALRRQPAGTQEIGAKSRQKPPRIYFGSREWWGRYCDAVCSFCGVFACPGILCPCRSRERCN